MPRIISNFTRHFLLAMPHLAEDAYFSRTLTFICEHNHKGALGIIINRPKSVTLGTLFQQVNVPLNDPEIARQPVYMGGPVNADRGFVLHRPLGDWKSTLNVDGYVGLTTSKDILEAMARHEAPGDQFVALGYASWAAGQLEEEIKRNDWLSVELDSDAIFKTSPEMRYELAMQQLGVSFSTLSDSVGHA